MVKTLSNMLELGTKAPAFSLPDVVTNKLVNLNDLKIINGLIIMFICNHCPFVKHINLQLVELANDYLHKGFLFIAINSNDIKTFPEDAPENMRKLAEEMKYPFPYLFDETQETAKAYRAACTPDFYVFDKNLFLVYRGQLDDSRPGNDIPVSGDSIRKALNYLLDNKKINFQQKPSLGCNIKWKT